MEERKLPLLGDVRDESTEDGAPGAGAEDARRRARSADGDAVPRHRAGVALPAEHERAGCDAHAAGDVAAARCCAPGSIIATRCWSAARATGSPRSSGGIEILDGYLLVYLNVDEVIRIIRNEDEPKPRLMQRFKLTDMQAEAILNMRLRSLRRLEEMEIRKEHKALTKERKDIQALLKDEALRWDRIAAELEDVAEEVRRRRAGRAAHRTRRGAAGGGGGERGVRRARADHRHPVRQGLDPRGEGPHRRRMPSCASRKATS